MVDEKKVMLVVDDTEINRIMLRQLFQDQFEMVEAVDGRSAIERLVAGKVQLILLDLVMPVMDGFEVLSYLARHDAYSDIPVVALVAAGDDDRAARALAAGAADFVTKPFTPLIVRRRVQNVLAGIENEWRKAVQAARENQIREMHHFIEVDALTGVYNRETFFRKTAQVLEKNASVSYEIIYFDINAFKVVNDLFRIETGNLILRTAASYLTAVAGQQGVAGRLEADHFALCLPHGTMSLDMLMQGLDSTVQSLGISHQVTFYAGVYPVENIYLPVEQMLDRAHLAESQVKGSYERRYCIYDDTMRQQLLREQMILRDMDFALQERQFEVYFQPIYQSTTGKIVSAEALVRWHHPTEGLIMPEAFVDLFEHNGFIVKLDRYVWDAAAQFLAEQRAAMGFATPISVNVSRLNFYGLGFLDYLKELMHRYELDPSLLRLEVTESAYQENEAQLVKATAACRAAGFLVLMDDFGSGSSSLNLLKDLPVDVLKIDFGFVRHVPDKERARIVLEGIVEMARRLGMGIIVEGVETEEQLHYLGELGCEVIQGYYYARPLKKVDYVARLEKDGK